MRLLLGFLCAALLIGCADVPPGGTYVQQRPEQLTLYQDGYVIKPVAGSETLRANCDFFLIPELDAAAALQAPDIPLAHFGVVFAKEGRNLDGSTYCTNQQSWNGGSVARRSGNLVRLPISLNHAAMIRCTECRWGIWRLGH